MNNATEARLELSEKSIDKQWHVLDDIRESLLEIKVSIAKIEVDQAKIKDLETRTKALENWRNYLLGAWAATVLLVWAAWEGFKGLKH